VAASCVDSSHAAVYSYVGERFWSAAGCLSIAGFYRSVVSAAADVVCCAASDVVMCYRPNIAGVFHVVSWLSDDRHVVLMMLLLLLQS